MQLQGICRLGTCISEVLSYVLNAIKITETFVVWCFTMLWEHAYSYFMPQTVQQHTATEPFSIILQNAIIVHETSNKSTIHQ